jgi:hypothetical protein
MDWQDFVNREFRLLDCTQNQPRLYRYQDLVKSVEHWQQCLQHNGARPGQTVGLVHVMNLDYFAVFYAALSQGLRFVVLDNRTDHTATHGLFLPLDFVILDGSDSDLQHYWQQHAGTVIDTSRPHSALEHIVDQTAFDPQTGLLSSCTSGSTRTPQPITHSYGFFTDLARRNSRVLNLGERCAHVRNLHHGSSLPVWFLPTVMSCNLHVCFDYENHADYVNSEQFVHNIRWLEYLDINHFMLPSNDWLVAVLNVIQQHSMQFRDLTLYTLGQINADLVSAVRDTNIKIVSIFGSTETSGPILLNSLHQVNADQFDPNVFVMPDDFYQITPVSNGTVVKARDHAVEHLMSDLFDSLGGGKYRHRGRSVAYALRGIQIDMALLDQIVIDLGIDGTMVIDQEQQTVSLAVWNQDCADTARQRVNIELASALDCANITVNHCENLNRHHFTSGIKPNQELIRQYFRNHTNVSIQTS